MKKSLLLMGSTLIVMAAWAATPALTQNAQPAKTEDAAAAKPANGKPADAKPAEIKPHARPKAARGPVSQPVDAQGRPVSTKSVAARTALCKADCSPAKYDDKTSVGIHGIYRSYQQFDPQLKSVEGQRSYNECVQKCVAPLPEVYVQRAIFAAGLSWFGKTNKDCLDCHEKGH